ncbi:MAG TPA: choice-of-anchor P family protein [Candidatus Dormibacteraeota bacterium]|nr:choice-of-anchor P family protein [Candidatus Dormibacteraeota bacterium]
MTTGGDVMSKLRRRRVRRRALIPLVLAFVAGTGFAAWRSLPQPARADQPPASPLGGVLSITNSLPGNLGALPSAASQIVSGLGGSVGALGGTRPATSRAAAGDGSDSGMDRAAALYSSNGLTLLGTLVLIPPDSGLCDTGNVPTDKAAPTVAAGLPVCNLAVPLQPLLQLNVLTDRVTGGATRSSSKSQVASLELLPKADMGIDVLDATLLTAATSATCGLHPTTSGSASVLTLTIAGQKVVATPDNPQNTAVSVGGLATVTFDYTNVNTSTSPATETASSVRIDFPATGPLAPLVKGTLFISYAKSQGFTDCPQQSSPPPTPTPTAPPGHHSPSPTPTATPTHTPCDSEAAFVTPHTTSSPHDECGESGTTAGALCATPCGTGGGSGHDGAGAQTVTAHTGAGTTGSASHTGLVGVLSSLKLAAANHWKVPAAFAALLLLGGLALVASSASRRRRRAWGEGFDRF